MKQLRRAYSQLPAACACRPVDYSFIAWAKSDMETAPNVS